MTGRIHSVVATPCDRQFFGATVDYGPYAGSALSTLIYSLIFTVIAVVWFRRKDISS